MKLLTTLLGLLILFVGCSASTGSRYETSKDTTTQTTTAEVETNNEIEEDFDITKYEPEIDIKAPPITTSKLPTDVWYEYSTVSADSSLKISGTTDGYRVQVISTDDIDKANSVRAEIYERTTRKEVYIMFEPPFYKVKVGDFTSKSEAENLRFRLNQIGFTESKVVQETVNIFE